ncbi:FkbM family methyltransferase [Streptomyces sp. NPDC048644]|uniref:FkbM family methyltransferase n=1 Tax=Streptomyces sp. NPDC048644 TaxID=3365582 RepID=UPI00371EDC3B
MTPDISAAAREIALDLTRWYVRHAPGTAGKAAATERFLNAGLRDHPRLRRARTRFGATFLTDTQDLIQRYLYEFGIWEPHLTHWLAQRLRSGDVFIDVGANIGYYSVLASKLVGPGGVVVSVEASPAFHQRLRTHARINGCHNIRAVNAAVSDREKTVRFILASSRNMGANSIVPYDGTAESTFDAVARPLPEIVTAEEIARARVIKIDVEGAEGSVLRGLAPMLDTLRPDAELAIEVTPQRMAELGDSAAELLETLASHGFHAHRLPNGYAPGAYATTAHRTPPTKPTALQRPLHDLTDETELIFTRT